MIRLTKEQKKKVRAKTLYLSLLRIYNNLEHSHQGLVDLKDRMEEDGLCHERDAVLLKLSEVISEFGDFMPGVEMEAEGEV